MLRIKVNSRLLKAGNGIKLTIKAGRDTPARIRLLKPGGAPFEIKTRQKGDVATATYSDTDRRGLYVFNVKTGFKTYKKWVLVENMVLDWYSVSEKNGRRDALEYLDSFSQRGNVVVLHNITGPGKTLYPSRRFPIAEGVESDFFDFFMKEAARRGCAILFSYHWVPEAYVEMWRFPMEKQISQAKTVIRELYHLYSRYDSMAGFYSYWEPGDVAELPYYEQTLSYVKKLDKGLFTASAPYLFSIEKYHGGSLPLIFSALSTVESLDCIIPQSSVAVYPYPLNRTKDHAALAAGSSILLGKIVLGHVETFARCFVENEEAPPGEFIKGQVLSTSFTRGVCGASTFIYSLLFKRDGKTTRSFDEAIRWLEETSLFRREMSPVGVYAPLNTSHWPTVLSPFLRKLRRLGLDASVVQQPLCENEEWERLVEDKVRVLVLPDPPELKASETRFLANYLRKGGSIIVLGYPPKGLRRLLGVESRNIGKYGGLKLLKQMGDRVPAGTLKRFGFELVFCATPTEAEPIGVYESIPSGFQPGAYGVTRMESRGGCGIFIGIPSIVVLEKTPELFLDALDSALSRSGLRVPWEIHGLTEDCDLLAGEDILMMVNLSEEAIRVTARYRCGNPPASFELMGSQDELLKLDGDALEIMLKPFKPIGVKPIFRKGPDRKP
jgi:hypothetical protein